MIVFYVPSGVKLSNILLFDTYDGNFNEALEIYLDEAEEFDFDVGGEAEILSCK